MTKTKVILLVSFVLVFVAGAAVGRVTVTVTTPGPHRRERRSWLGDELNLTAEQREQMRAIWSEAMGSPEEAPGERHRTLAAEREQAVRQLLSEEQTQQYEQILQDYQDKLAQSAQERAAAFQEAVARTKEILTPEQAQKYEAMMSRMGERGEQRPRRPGPPRSGRSGPPPMGPPPEMESPQ